MDEGTFTSLINYLEDIPAIEKPIGTSADENGFWWVKFSIDINHKLAWNVVQELSCVINYISVNERLPKIFYPISPAPYMNGGPEEFLSWIIETKDKDFEPDNLTKWLEGRLPRPVNDLEQWKIDD